MNVAECDRVKNVRLLHRFIAKMNGSLIFPAVVMCAEIESYRFEKRFFFVAHFETNLLIEKFIGICVLLCDFAISMDFY